MRRFLIVDDEEELAFDDELRDDNVVDGIQAEVIHINPTPFIKADLEAEKIVTNLLEKVRLHSVEFWDVVAIDLNLGNFHFEQERQNKEVCLRIAEAFREQNKSATVFLYSGTLMNYIRDLMNFDANDTPLRKIFKANEENFVQRNRIASEITAAVDEPSWVLRVDRMLMQSKHLKVTPKEAAYSGLSFEELAAAVRQQDSVGRKIIELISEYGISAFVDLNS
jgi:hypothetical protein